MTVTPLKLCLCDPDNDIPIRKLANLLIFIHLKSGKITLIKITCIYTKVIKKGGDRRWKKVK